MSSYVGFDMGEEGGEEGVQVVIHGRVAIRSARSGLLLMVTHLSVLQISI